MIAVFGLTYYLALGGTATFRPADLRPDRVWFDGALITHDQFTKQACDARAAST